MLSLYLQLVLSCTSSASMACTVPTALNVVWSTTLTLVVLYFCVILIIARKQIWKKSTKASVILNYTFYGIILLCAILWSAGYIIDCADSNLSSTSALFYSFGSLCYVIQYVLLLLLLFRRLCRVFDNTEHSISSRTIYIFYGTLLALSLFGLLGAFVPNEGALRIVSTGSDILGIIGFVVLISIIIGTFIQRLRAVWHESNAEASSKRIDFEAIIIKHFLLTIFSIISMLIMLLYIIIGAGVPAASFDDYRAIVGQFIVGFDLLSNFVSVLFGFGYFGRYYGYLCRCYDRKLMTSLNIRKGIESVVSE